MSANPQLEFHWLSPLGVSVFLFLLQAVLTMVACLIVFALNSRITSTANRVKGGFLLSGRIDSLFFGKSIEQIIQDNPQLMEIDRYSLYVRAGIWLAFGIFQIALAWFGMRQGQTWAFWAIVLANIAALAGWLMVILPVIRKRIPLGFDLPPVVLIMAGFILPLAGILGWIGLS
jgi:hypothetical protein